MRVLPLAIATGGLLLVAAAVLGTCNGCAGTGPDALPEDESKIQVVADAAPPPPAPVPAPVAKAPAAQAPTARPPLPSLERSAFEELRLSGTRGGKLAYELDGDVDAVVAVLLDMEAANGKRPWAKAYKEVARSGETLDAQWKFAGKMGVAPTVVLRFETERRADGSVRIPFKLIKKAFGVAAFFGDYVVEDVKDVPGRSRLTARTFINSGLPFVNATYQDIENGLREDARSLRDWVRSRR